MQLTFNNLDGIHPIDRVRADRLVLGGLDRTVEPVLFRDSAFYLFIEHFAAKNTPIATAFIFSNSSVKVHSVRFPHCLLLGHSGGPSDHP